VPIGLIGASFHWWKDKLPSTRDWLARQSDRWWPAALLVAFIYAAGPGLYQRTFPSTAKLQSTGRIAWNIEQAAQGGGYFLNMTKLNDHEIRVLGFQAHGKNNSNDPISQISGYIRSDKTNAQRPIYLQAQDQEENKALACFPHPWIPTLPDQTFGIPPLADFEIGTYDKPYAEVGKDGIPLSQFLSTFSPFTVVLEYDGTKLERRFSQAEINKQIEIFQKSLNPLSAPHILRTENAAPAHFPNLRPLTPSPQATPVPSLPGDHTITGKIPSKD
jgi:hypothetical protein